MKMYVTSSYSQCISVYSTFHFIRCNPDGFSITHKFNLLSLILIFFFKYNSDIYQLYNYSTLVHKWSYSLSIYAISFLSKQFQQTIALNLSFLLKSLDDLVDIPQHTK